MNLRGRESEALWLQLGKNCVEAVFAADLSSINTKGTNRLCTELLVVVQLREIVWETLGTFYVSAQSRKLKNVINRFIYIATNGNLDKPLLQYLVQTHQLNITPDQSCTLGGLEHNL